MTSDEYTEWKSGLTISAGDSFWGDCFCLDIRSIDIEYGETVIDTCLINRFGENIYMRSGIDYVAWLAYCAYEGWGISCRISQ